MPNPNGLKMCRVRCASPTLHVFLLLNYDMDTDMYATIEKRSRAYRV